MKIINYINKNLNMIILWYFSLLLVASWITDNTQSMILSGTFFLYYKIEILQESLKEKPKVSNVTIVTESATEALTTDEYDALLEMRRKRF